MAVSATDVKILMKKAGMSAATVDALEPAAPLLTQGLDSVDLPTLAAAAEVEFSIDLSDGLVSTLRTLDDFVAFINAKLG